VLGLCLLLLSACGGGEESESPIELTLAPGSLFLSQFKGQSLPLQVNAAVTFREEVTGTVQIVIVDTGGILGPGTEIKRQSSDLYTASLRTQASLSAGQHKGAFEIRLCADTACQQRYGGTTLPYDITVFDESATQQPPLSAWTGVSDWTTLNGDAAHRGHLPVRLDPKRFSKRWTWSDTNQTEEPNDARLSAPVSSSADGIAYLKSSRLNGTSAVLYALKESDGSQVWRSALGASHSSGPALAGGQIYIAALESQTHHLWAINARTGTTTFKAPVPAGTGSIEVPAQPAVVDQTVYVNSGEMKALNASTGAVIWSMPSSGYSGIPPAVDTGRLYYYRPGVGGSGAAFTALNKASGSTAFTVATPSPPSQQGVVSYRGSAPALTGSGRALVNRNGGEGSSPLECIDLATQKLAWDTGDSSFSGAPVVAGNVVYALNYTLARLEARSLEDGRLLWHWSPTTSTGGGLYGNVVAADNIVFVSVGVTAPDHVFAVDIEKRAAVWSYPRSGQLSLSASGLLYITSEDKVTAINLK
jgi:outer membrane protein assembly factor BamB